MQLLQIYNYAPHYRSTIYSLIDKSFDCAFVFGDSMGDIKKIDYTLLSHKVSEVKNVKCGIMYYQKGVLSLFFKPYDIFILTGEIRCISTWLFLFLSRFYFSKKVYLWSHGWLGKENWIKRQMGRLFYGMADGVFLYNNRSREIMIQGGFPPNTLHTIYNSLNYDDQLIIRSSLTKTSIYQDHFRNKNKTLIFIGRLTKVKKLDLLLTAVSRLKRQGSTYNIVFVGDGEERKNLERLAEESSLSDSVWFYGSCYNELINAELIYNADLCVSPGNIGLTAIHVMMFGCPAITNDDFDHQMPEFETIQNGLTGSFFHVDDCDSLADCIQTWFAQHKDDREIIRQACCHEVDSKWNPHNQIKIIKEVFGV